MRLPWPASFLLGLALALTACRDAKVASYRIPKEPDAPVPARVTANPSVPPPGSPAMAGLASTVPAGSDLGWTAAAGWQSRPPTEMRKATYFVPGEGGAFAELAISSFPGDVGGELANVNRWRGQFALPPIADAELAGAVTRLMANGFPVALVELTGGPAGQPQQLLGAMVPCGGATWFLKFTGPPALVAQEKPAFLAFLQSLHAP